MPFRHLLLFGLIEAWLHAKTARSRSKRSLTPWLSAKTVGKKLRKKANGKFCGDSRDSNDARGMSESARIAFAYRVSQKPGGVVPNSDLWSSRGIRLTLESDGTQDSDPNVESSSLLSAETSELHHQSLWLTDMLSMFFPVIIEKDDKEVLDQEACRLALRRYRSFCSNVIVESQCPDRSPHIVITPPPEEDVFRAPYVAQTNQVPFQHHPSLAVPPLNTLTCHVMTIEQWGTTFYHQSHSYGSANHCTPENRLVFSRSKLGQWVKGTEEHRNCLFRRLIIPAVTRHTLKASAITASLLAPSFRTRYDTPGFLASLETPFRWSDPASAFLSQYRGHPVGVHHIPSPEPFSVPHILIEESFGNDQIIVDGNVAPIQNSAHKNTLFVPSSTNGHDVSGGALELEELSLGYDSSACQSSPPKTPIELGKVDYDFFSSWDIGTPLGDDFFPRILTHPTTGIARPFRDSKALFFIEEEEDGFI